MTLELGDTLWIPCNVTHGVFPDQRSVMIDLPGGRWTGVVDVGQLRDAITDGQTAIRATIVEAEHGEFAARLPGQTMRRQYLTLTET
jgi:hypothetical protein